MSANEALNRVWSTFRSDGIADDLTIIEYIARLLLNASGLEIPGAERLLPRQLPQRPNLASVPDQLQHAVSQVPGGDNVNKPAILFDQHVLFRLTDMLAGGRYPTPRHITRFMHNLVQVSPTNSLADFACGSGGLLIGRFHPNLQVKTIGYEISPEWAKIARANMLLHGIPVEADTIQDGNALNLARGTVVEPRLFDIEVNADAEGFDCILMNPPFGERIDAFLSERALGQRVGRSETALIKLALLNLAPEGRAGVLSAAGLLVSNSLADKDLRAVLVEHNTLNAVIAFPKDAFQPYSPLQTNLLLFKKTQPPPNHHVWFFELEQDGYPSGRSRDLTKYPSAQANDLPFVEQVWEMLDEPPNAHFPEGETPSISVHWLLREAGCPGVVCTGLTHDIKSVKFISRPEVEPVDQATDAEVVEPTPQLRVELVAPPAEPKVTVTIPIPPEVWALPGAVSASTEASDNEETEPDDESGNVEDPVEQSGETAAIQLLSRPARGVAIAFFRQGEGTLGESPRLIGACVSTSDIEQQAYDLRPERYVVKPTESQILASPSTLLGQIYANQLKLAKRIDNLFGHLELPPIATQQLPSPLLEDEELPLVTQFNEEQKAIWTKVCERTGPAHSDEADNYETATLFTPQDISRDNAEDMAEAKRTLDLMERMGLIVPVTITETQSDESSFFYRRVTQRDLWQSDSGTSNSEEET
ncbi:HsdM family class I SAM-dependent methyltransferase [Nodosilinea sp. AN01ver1]|uniref:HsdM family class I SAM-dependent methyltransferase n=1 Tax=Nodosilinea sp. AN01ver1 TaxID=3423362 RepID=UPI003D312146